MRHASASDLLAIDLCGRNSINQLFLGLLNK
jgi:hypothetical protein